ncbi:hypothetical protein [Solibacillus merdavium]|uniref:Uncharacterized protein n=1 Tax=Solibacillus merdavium TaxID=2762218 RepID=A0ABR8XP66_9BACL|nr:hypothetical protein [Solibacillus merdavium]MBD8033734.1 hypothetical protein [Solibacillus merdavium]
MNEIKRQLNKKMGSTSKRSEQVMAKVNVRKRQKQPFKKSNRLYYATFVIFLAMITLTILVMNPWSLNDFSQTTPTVPVDEEIKETIEELPLQKYFKEDGDVAYFLGMGNEYAGFTETTTWLSDEYVEILEDNTGAVMQKVYRIKTDAIELVYEEIMEFEKKSFTLTQLNQLDPIQTIIKLPVKDGFTFEGQAMSYPVKLITPYKEYDNLVQITKEIEGGKNYFYYDNGDGLVAKQFITNDGHEILSLLGSINELPTINKEKVISFKNTLNNTVEEIPFYQLTFLNQLLLYKYEADNFELTYEPLFTDKDTEIGVFKYNCLEQYCENAFVKRLGEDITFGSLVWGKLQSFKLSPNYENILMSITLDEYYEDTLLPRAMLHVLNIDKMEVNLPSSKQDYFTHPWYPIFHYEWIDDKTIQAEVPDIENYESPTIYKWRQTKQQKTKIIEVSLPY